MRITDRMNQAGGEEVQKCSRVANFNYAADDSISKLSGGARGHH